MSAPTPAERREGCRYCGIEPDQELPRPSYSDLRAERDALREQVELLREELCPACNDYFASTLTEETQP